MTAAFRRGLSVALLAAALPAPAAAQAASGALQGIEASIGIGVMGGAGAGGGDATLRPSGAGAPPFVLFSTESRMHASPVFELRGAVALTPSVGIEMRFGRNRPELRTAITADFEGAPALEVAEQIDQYAVDAALVVVLDRWRVAGVTPFVSGGGGYLRQLHEGATLVEEGQVFHVGGGVRRWLWTSNGLVDAVGVRGDVRLSVLRGGIASDAPRVHPAASVSLLVGF